MLDKSKIGEIVNKSVEGTDKFLVDVSVSSTNVVNVFVDGDEGITIQECVRISKLIESVFEREVEDYELRVSSPGLSRPFQLIRQYQKYINREIEVKTSDEKKIKGVLKSVTENNIEIEIKSDKKGSNTIVLSIRFSEIHEAKPVISFN